MLTDVLNSIDALLGSAAYFPFLLLGVGLFFTVYLGFPQFRYFGEGWRVLFGRDANKDDPGDTSHFQALSTALSGTVGTGNIGGVALALYLGGPAALFWMWATALVGMTTSLLRSRCPTSTARQTIRGRWRVDQCTTWNTRWD